MPLSRVDEQTTYNDGYNAGLAGRKHPHINLPYQVRAIWDAGNVVGLEERAREAIGMIAPRKPEAS